MLVGAYLEVAVEFQGRVATSFYAAAERQPHKLQCSTLEDDGAQQHMVE
jgi:hypothetical protein